MKELFSHPYLDSLYERYNIESSKISDSEVGIQIRGNEDDVPFGHHLMATHNIKKNEIYIDSLEWRGSGHELMLFFLLEMYHERARIILDARTKDDTVITQKNLENFYRKFWFQKISASYLDESAAYMEWVDWNSVKRQLQEYICRWKNRAVIHRI